MERFKKIRLPWIPGFRKPNFVFELPKIDLTDSTTKSSIYILLTIFVSLMVGGFVYMLVNNPPAIASDNQGNPVIVLSGINNLDRQTLLEGLTVIFLFLMSSIGMFILRTSSEMATEEEARSLWLYGGLILVAIGVFGLMLLFGVKLGTPR
jgi:uncharacterized membrane protein